MHDHVYSFASVDQIIKAYKALVTFSEYFAGTNYEVQHEYMMMLFHAASQMNAIRMNYDYLEKMQQLFSPADVHQLLRSNQIIAAEETLSDLSPARRAEVNMKIQTQMLADINVSVIPAELWFGKDKDASRPLYMQTLKEHSADLKSARKILPAGINQTNLRGLPSPYFPTYFYSKINSTC